MYPKVKVREAGEEADQYSYERSSLQSLKAFEWQSSCHFSFADESLGSVVRIPRFYVPMSPPSSFHSSKEETNEKMTDGEDDGRNVRTTSTPRPRAVLSSPGNSHSRKLFGVCSLPPSSFLKEFPGSKYYRALLESLSKYRHYFAFFICPDNDGISLSKAQTRRELLSGLKDHNSCQNRHIHCKMFPRSAVAESFAPTKRQDKELIDYKDNGLAKGRNTTLAGSSTRGGQRKRITPAAIHD